MTVLSDDARKTSAGAIPPALRAMHAEWRDLDSCLAKLHAAAYRDRAPASPEELQARHRAQSVMSRRRADLVRAMASLHGTERLPEAPMQRPDAEGDIFSRIKPTRALRQHQPPVISEAGNETDPDRQPGDHVNAGEHLQATLTRSDRRG